MEDTLSISVNELPDEEQEVRRVVQEETVRFKKHTDKMTLSVNAEDGEVVAQITGYGIETGFNYKYFKNEEDVQAAANAIAELAVKLIMEAMVEKINKEIDRHKEI